MPLGAGGWELYGFGSYGHRDGLSAANYRQQSAAANRDYRHAGARPDADRRQFRAADPGRLPALYRHRPRRLCRHGRRCAASSAAGTPICRSATAITASTIWSATALNTSFGTASQSVFDAGGLRYGQLVANLDFSREYEIGLATPLSVAAGARISQREFPDPAGRPPILRHRPAVPRLVHDDRGELRRPRAACSMPAPASAASRAGPRRPAPRASRASPPPAPPTKAGTATRPMSSSTPTRSRASPSPSPAASSISPISATR